MSEQTNNTGMWGAIALFFSNLFRRRNAEEKVEIIQAKIDVAVQKAKVKEEVKVIKAEAKVQEKINKKISKNKKALAVEKLKVGRSLYVTHPGTKKRDKIVYTGYDYLGVYDQQGTINEYGTVFTYHGRPIAKPGLV